MKKILKYLKDNYKQLIVLLILIIAVNIEFPYYIEAPGGTINLTKKMNEKYDEKEGSLNMLYVTEYKANIVTLFLGKLFKTWDIYEISNQQISNEDANDIQIRNRVMLENSVQTATLMAYKEAGIDINIKSISNIVIATTKDNGIKIGDEILKINNQEIKSNKEVIEMLQEKEVGSKISILLKRNGKLKEVNITLDEDKVIGVMIITNYEYELPNDINLTFNKSEGGASGGLILSLGIYQEITDIDLLKGRKIAGTGTIEPNGNIGEIGGVKYKIAGAVKDKMDIILISPYNYEEAKQVIKENNYKIELVCVETLKEAIEYLSK